MGRYASVGCRSATSTARTRSIRPAEIPKGQKPRDTVE
jgi:hypothetical protein